MDTYSCSASCLITVFDLKSDQWMFSSRLRHLFSKVFSFCSTFVVAFQLSHPYVNVGIMQELKILSFVLFLSVFECQIFEFIECVCSQCNMV